MSSPGWYLFCYDIADEKRLRRLHHFICNEGIPLQYSVFLLHSTTMDLMLLVEAIRELISEKDDDIRIYPISTRIEFLALGRQEPGQGMTLSGEGLIQLNANITSYPPE